MSQAEPLIQHPPPGTRRVRFRGDTQKFTLTLAGARGGEAWIRTNIGNAGINRGEIIRGVDRSAVALGRDWFDLPMRRTGEKAFEVTLPLFETGRFEAKCFFLPAGRRDPQWPPGPNVQLNVAPADTCCGNIVYNAFVRQFGPNKAGALGDPPGPENIEALDRAGYTVIPPSGTFRDLIAELDFIIGHLGCRIIQLLPIHPTPTTYARMGRFGSPYASLSFSEVDPALARFDPKATPLDQFVELVDAVHARNGRLFIDIAINHTGWAASIHETHPEWLARKRNGEIEVPGAWGVEWADLTRLDYSHRELWRYMAGMFLKWCRRGVDGFRCDAGYMIPVDAWTYIVAAVREQYPESVFVLEGLGGKISVTRDLLNRAGFDWSYSELFQNYDRRQIEDYLPLAVDMSTRDGIAVHFAETHDNDRLASRSTTFARLRTALCALLSHEGAFGFANGVEWFAEEKINVHGSPSLNWGAETNQVDAVRRLTTLLKRHPAFHDGARLRMIQKGDGNQLVVLRHHPPSGGRLLILANLDTGKETTCRWEAAEAGMTGDAFTDLLTRRRVPVAEAEGIAAATLEAGAVYCLSPRPDSPEAVTAGEGTPPGSSLPPRVERQRLRAKALEVIGFFRGVGDLGDLDADGAAETLRADPLDFCRRSQPEGDEPRAVVWNWPRDVAREVMVPPGHLLLVRSPEPFRARIEQGDRVVAVDDALPGAEGAFFTLLLPGAHGRRHRPVTLVLSVFSGQGCRHARAPLLLLAPFRHARPRTAFHRAHVVSRPLVALGTNGRGGMLRAHADWGFLASRYDALLAANLNPECPDNRRVMLTRCRAWVVYQGYSRAVTADCLENFGLDAEGNGCWEFLFPTGQGQQVRVTARVAMAPGRNDVRISFFRHPSEGGAALLDDGKAVKLIVRPDIEDRDFHETTKAYLGAESHFPACVTPAADRFTFAPDPLRVMEVALPGGGFTWEPEWQYMVHRPVEAERGLDPDSDLFSPGYFEAAVRGGQTVDLTARIVGAGGGKGDGPGPVAASGATRPGVPREGVRTLEDVLDAALERFVVRRGALKTVIAGYPWFLDWGRDALIAVRGMIAAGRRAAAADILEQFGRFEERGTLPNMIQGSDAGNRDTSDGPLWFVVACRDMVGLDGDTRFLDSRCGERTFRQVLASIGESYRAGTPNGIRMDAASGLIFSPAHFTWMDTNYPAGTPREGYPVEIQALWMGALEFLAAVDTGPSRGDWAELAGRVRQSLRDRYWLEEEGYLSDCLHAAPGVPAAAAERDDALRPNQLFALTMGAVKDRRRCGKILAACGTLLVPGAIRSLADRPVTRPLPIRRGERLLNDPFRPYRGNYLGDEDTLRKPAYHNGTAWTWPFPAFCEAWAMTYGHRGRETARHYLGSVTQVIDRGCVGQVPEILDGDYPHRQRGCDAQAWGASEFLRVWRMLAGGSH